MYSNNSFVSFYFASLHALEENWVSQLTTGLAAINIVVILTLNSYLLRFYYKLLDWKIRFSYVRLTQSILEMLLALVVIPAMFTLDDDVMTQMGKQEPCFGSLQMIFFWMPHYVLQLLNAFVIIYWKAIFTQTTHIFEFVTFLLACVFVVAEFINSSWGLSIACFRGEGKPDLYYYLVYILENPPVLFLLLAMSHSYWVAHHYPKQHMSPVSRKIWRKMTIMFRFQITYDSILFCIWAFNNIGHVLNIMKIVDIYTGISRPTTNIYLILAPIVRSGCAFWYAWINDKHRRSERLSEFSSSPRLVWSHGPAAAPVN